MTPFKLLSLALSHPDAELLDLLLDVEAEARELPPGPVRDGLLAGLAGLATTDPIAASARYVATFDFNRRCALDLTFASHGDRRQRGVALLKLRRLYARLGVEHVGDELPDHLPLLLELADALGEERGRELLAEFRPAIEVLRGGLHRDASPYAPLLDALCALLGPLEARDAESAMRLAADGPPGEEVGLEPFAPPEAMPAAAAAGGAR